MIQLQWHTEQRKVNDLLPQEINPRKISEARLKKLMESLDKFNLAEIPALNLDNTIIAGHQRIKSLKLAGRGDELIDVRIPNRLLTELEVKEYMLMSNNHAGEWDFDILDKVFTDIDISGLGFDMFGYEEWKRKNDRDLAKASGDDNYEVPLSGLDTDIVEGDIIQIGKHRLICGSSTKKETWTALMAGELGDLVITDPPYNVDYVGKTKNALKISGDRQEDGQFYQFLRDFYTSCAHFIKAGGAWYVWHADSEGANFRRAMADSGIHVKQCLIWVKNSMVMGRQDYQWKHEPCLYGWKEGAAHNWYSDRKQTTVLTFDRPSRNAEHPTMKPIPLISYQITNSSKEEDIICDGFGGSGTTMVASEQMNRRCRMIELDPRYCQVIVDRMIKLNPGIKVTKNGTVTLNPKPAEAI